MTNTLSETDPRRDLRTVYQVDDLPKSDRRSLEALYAPPKPRRTLKQATRRDDRILVGFWLVVALWAGAFWYYQDYQEDQVRATQRAACERRNLLVERQRDQLRVIGAMYRELGYENEGHDYWRAEINIEKHLTRC